MSSDIGEILGAGQVLDEFSPGGISFVDCRCQRSSVAARCGKVLTRRAAAESPARTAEMAPAEPTTVSTPTGVSTTIA